MDTGDPVHIRIWSNDHSMANLTLHAQARNLSVADELTGLILDGTKVRWHQDRIQAWENGEKFAPITIDMALTRACNYSCSFCYAMLQENDRHNITWEVMERFLNEAAEKGVKGISFVSDGESTLSPVFFKSLKLGHELGISMAVGTNGWLLTPDKLDQFMPYLTYLRFNISAGTPDRYAEIMGVSEDHFHQVIDNARAMMEWKTANQELPTVGFQMVLMPQDADQIVPFAQRAIDSRVDYGIIKHCSDDEAGSLGVDYEKYPALYPVLEAVEGMSTSRTAIRAKWSKITQGPERSYSRCYGAPFILQISGSGLIAPCGMLFNQRYASYHIGNIVQDSFKDLLEADEYWDVMNRLASPEFDANRMCGALCLQHKTNEALDYYVKGLDDLKPAGAKPEHLNFI